nr:hypothetical protein [Tanacetum cinerariifolium]
MNMGQDRQMQMVRGNGGNQFRQYARQNAGNPAGYNDVIGNQVIQNAVQNPKVQNVGNPNGLMRVQGNGNQNQIGNGNLVAARAKRNAAGQNGNQIRCYNWRGIGHYAKNYTARPRRRDAAYLQTQLLIAQKEEAGIQLQAEEYDLMAAVAYLDDIEEVNANYGSAEIHKNYDDNEIFNMFTQEEQYTELLEPISELHQVPQNDNDVVSEVTGVVQGFIDADHPSHVCKLKKAIYGLKQAPRAWYDELSTFLLQNHFIKGTIDPTLFIRRFHDDILVVQVYVDDSIFGSSHPRPDIVHATCFCARYQAKPTEKHLKEVKRIFRYLRGTVNMGLWYTKDFGFELTGFSDADYAGCKDTFKSTSGGAQFLSEKLLTDYGFHFDKILIYCDSKSAIAISFQHSRTKHIAVRFHFIKEHVEKGTIELYFVKTDYQLAGIFTKALPTYRFNYLVRRLGMRSLSPKELERLAKSL